MTKIKINYSKCSIYKLCCRDPSITGIYIGSTTNLRARKNGHKSKCTNINSKGYNLYVYQYIRDNGGWQNWDLVVIETLQCNNSVELHTRERYYIDALKAMLNKNIPNRTDAEYREDNKEKIIKYYEDNKEKIIAKTKKYYENNKVKVYQWKTQKFNCPCGGKYDNTHKSRHEKSKKHLNYINNQNAV